MKNELEEAFLQAVETGEASCGARLAEQADLGGSQKELLFEEDGEPLRRLFSCWRWQAGPSEIRFSWELRASLGRGPVQRVHGVVLGITTFLRIRDLKEYLNKALPVDDYARARTPRGVQVEVGKFLELRKLSWPSIQTIAWRQLGEVLETEYRADFENLYGAGQELLEKARNLDPSLIPFLDDLTGNPLFPLDQGMMSALRSASPGRHYAAVAAVQFFGGIRDVSTLPEAFAAYSLGLLWFDNRDKVDELITEMDALKALRSEDGV